MIVQISALPEGGEHRAEMPYDDLERAVARVVGHFEAHANGGYVGIAPTPEHGFAVQLHDPDGRIEAWRILRREIGDAMERTMRAEFPLYFGWTAEAMP